MTYDDFIAAVQTRARLATREEAEGVVRATLETLGERLEYQFADNLAAQLPAELGRHLRTDAAFQRLSFDGFISRVCAKEGAGCERPQALRHMRQVFEVLQEALTFGAAEKLRQQLSSDFEPLFDKRVIRQSEQGEDGRSDARA